MLSDWMPLTHGFSEKYVLKINQYLAKIWVALQNHFPHCECHCQWSIFVLKIFKTETQLTEIYRSQTSQDDILINDVLFEGKRHVGEPVN